MKLAQGMKGHRALHVTSVREMGNKFAAAVLAVPYIRLERETEDERLRVICFSEIGVCVNG